MKLSPRRIAYRAAGLFLLFVFPILSISAQTITTDEALFILESDGEVVPTVAFSSDGTRLLTSNLMGDATLWDAATGEVTDEP